MASNDLQRTGFRIANGPVVRRHPEEQSLVDFGELPKISGAPILFAIARDPGTLFVYWSIDWASLFGQEEPLDRKVYLRALKPDGTEESESAIEPMLGTFYAQVKKPGGVYRVELGYYRQSGAWRSVVISDAVTMPPEGVSENATVDVATVPFHLSFQKMIDLFCESNGDELMTALSRLQDRALSEEDGEGLTDEEREILRALNLSLTDIGEARRLFRDRARSEILRRKAEALLGFGATSPGGAFGPTSPGGGLGGSSWG